MFSFIKETKTNFDNLRAMEDTRDSGFKDMLDTSNSFSSNMEHGERGGTDRPGGPYDRGEGEARREDRRGAGEPRKKNCRAERGSEQEA